MNCHTAEGFGPCHETSLYLDWRCKELKAKLYVYFIDNPTCLKDLMKYHPDFAEYYEICLNAICGIAFNMLLILSLIFMIFNF